MSIARVNHLEDILQPNTKVMLFVVSWRDREEVAFSEHEVLLCRCVTDVDWSWKETESTWIERLNWMWHNKLRAKTTTGDGRDPQKRDSDARLCLVAPTSDYCVFFSIEFLQTFVVSLLNFVLTWFNSIIRLIKLNGVCALPRRSERVRKKVKPLNRLWGENGNEI